MEDGDGTSHFLVAHLRDLETDLFRGTRSRDSSAHHLFLGKQFFRPHG